MFRIRGYLPRITVRTVARVLKDHGGRVADIACGRGVLLKEISTHNNKNVVGIDIDTGQIEYARSAGMTVVLEIYFQCHLRMRYMILRLSEHPYNSTL